MAAVGPTGSTALADLTWPEAERRGEAGAVLLVPLGSTEQHGPHLTLSTDTDIASALCNRAATAAVTDALVAPALPYGASDEHIGFAGTLSIGAEALTAVVIALGRWAMATFERVIFVSGHGGNAGPLARAVDDLAHQGHRVETFALSGFRDAHAGHSETSIQLALDDREVHLSRAQAGNTTATATLMPAMVAGGVRSVSPNGVLGDPTTATAGDGSVLLATMVSALTKAIDRPPGKLAQS